MPDPEEGPGREDSSFMVVYSREALGHWLSQDKHRVFLPGHSMEEAIQSEKVERAFLWDHTA